MYLVRWLREKNYRNQVMDNVYSKSSSNCDINSSRVRKSLFVLNAGKVLDVVQPFRNLFVFISFDRQISTQMLCHSLQTVMYQLRVDRLVKSDVPAG